MQNKVLAANKHFYEVVADAYEKIDSRRTSEKQNWLLEIIKHLQLKLKNNFPKEALKLLDAGAGSGFLSRHADSIFLEICALDLSPKMLGQIANLKTSTLSRVEGSCENMPFESESFHMIGAFATLHHLFNPELFFQEAYRVLKKDGLLYCDHDLSMAFAKKFHWPLRLYRSVFDHSHKYLAHFPSLTQKEYELSEFHGDTGLSEKELKAHLIKIGFREIQISCHWEGSGAPGLLFAHLPIFRDKFGWAPMIRIVAKK